MQTPKLPHPKYENAYRFSGLLNIKQLTWQHNVLTNCNYAIILIKNACKKKVQNEHVLLTMACSILLSMATALVPEAL